MKNEDKRFTVPVLIGGADLSELLEKGWAGNRFPDCPAELRAEPERMYRLELFFTADEMRAMAADPDLNAEYRAAVEQKLTAAGESLTA